MSQYSPPIPVTASSAEAMAALGASIGSVLKRGDVVLLFGDLGVGKTTFSRGLIRHLSPDTTEVVSPTFTLVQTYEAGSVTLYHYDLYRLEIGDESTLTELGWEESLTDGITLVEWSERLVDSCIPNHALQIHIDHLPDRRELRLIGNAEWQSRLSGIV